MALVNFISSSINQWTLLVGMIPFIYSLGMGRVEPVVFDEHQKLEILLTIVQSYLGFLVLVKMDFRSFRGKRTVHAVDYPVYDPWHTGRDTAGIRGMGSHSDRCDDTGPEEEKCLPGVQRVMQIPFDLR